RAACGTRGSHYAGPAPPPPRTPHRLPFSSPTARADRSSSSSRAVDTWQSPEPRRFESPPGRLNRIRRALSSNAEVVADRVGAAGSGAAAWGPLVRGAAGSAASRARGWRRARQPHAPTRPAGPLGGRVAGTHDDRRHVGADRQRREVERPEPRADLLEPAEVGRVAGKVEALDLAGDDPAAPEAAVTVPRRPSREVLRRDAGEGEL